MKTRDFIITIFFIGVLLVVYGFFPTKNLFQKLTTLFVFLIIMPVVFNKFFLKSSLYDLGCRIGNYKQGIILSAYSLLLVGGVLYLFVKYTDLLKYYLIPKNMTQDFWSFFIYELFFTTIFVFIYELFFRGFVFFNIIKRYNYYLVIIIQAVLFLFFVWATSASLWPFLPYLVFSPIAGFIVYKSNSLIYSGLTQLIILILFDASVVGMINK